MPEEFSLIANYFQPLTEGNPAALSLKDDAALISPRDGVEMVITKDMLAEGVHFFPGDDPGALAQKALRVNLSDLAAMGATPAYYFLGLALPKTIEECWIAKFSKGLREDNTRFGIALLGGDTTAHEGGIVISITAMGYVPIGQALKRSGARPGDKIMVSGTIGDSALGLKLLQGEVETSTIHRDFLYQRYYMPQPRMELGEILCSVATTCMDISDGLLQDLGHIVSCSNVGAEIYTGKLPLSEATRQLVNSYPALWETIITGGDDYELLFTIPPEKEVELQKIAKKTAIPVTAIGVMAEGKGIAVLDEHHRPMQFKKTGYRHFR